MAALALALLVIVPAAEGANAAAVLKASFNTRFNGAASVQAHSDVAAGVSAAQESPEGRIAPFGGDHYICDELLVGTWATGIDVSKAGLDAVTFEFELDGEVLDTVRTPNERLTQEWIFDGVEYFWWFSEGVPVLGNAAEVAGADGFFTIQLTIDDPASDQVFGPTLVYVSHDYCS